MTPAGTQMAANRQVRFRDLSVTDPVRRKRLLDAVEKVLTHGQMLLGPEVDGLERTLAKYCGTRFCVGLSSGTEALHLALRSLGIGSGDEVITTPLSWIATANAIHLAGAVPVFVDIAEDLNLNADLIEDAITARTRAIAPVHFTGRICNMRTIREIARRHRLLIVEDAAQAFGAELDGVRAGAFGDAGAFSLNPMKVFAGCGEAGAVATNRQDAHEKLSMLRYLGTRDREICDVPSLNAKIDTVQAAMLLVNFDYLDRNIARRREIAAAYTDALEDVVQCPPAAAPGEEQRSVFFDYQIIAENRDDLRAFLERRGIEVRIKHPILMPDQPAYAHLPRHPLPVAERMVKRILSLPIHEKLTDEDVSYVAEQVRAFYRGGA